MPATLELRRSLVDELCIHATELGDPALEYWAHNQERQNSIEHGDFGRAEAALERTELIANELDQPALKWHVTFARAGWKLIHGDLVGGEELSRSAFQIGHDVGESDAYIALGSQLALVRRYQGRAREIIDAVQQSAEHSSLYSWRAGLPWMLCAVDRRAEASALLEQAAQDGFEQIPQNNSLMTALALYAESAIETSSHDAAASLYRLMEPSADQFVWNGISGYGHVRMYLGLLAACTGQHEQAEQHLAFACEFHETNAMPIWAARTHLGWAEALAERGDTSGGRPHATRALEISREHGYGLFEPRAAALVKTGSAAGA